MPAGQASDRGFRVRVLAPPRDGMPDRVSEYATRAVFVFEPESEILLEACQANSVGTDIRALPLQSLIDDPDSLGDDRHLLVAASMDGLKQVLQLAEERELHVGIVPMADQSRLRRYFDLPRSTDAAIELALGAEPKPMDIARCNGEIVLFRAVIGWLPLLDAPDDLDRRGMIRQLLSRWRRLRLYPYSITTANGKQINTAATGCMIVERHQGDVVSRLIGEELSIRDGKVGLVIASPFSMMEYLRFLYQLFSRLSRKVGLPDSVGYVQSKALTIDSDKVKDVDIDGRTVTQTPVHVEVQPAAVRVNLGPALMEADVPGSSDKESVRIDSLRSEEELSRSIGRRVPFFSYASEERFRDLFTALAADARLNNSYIVFSLLSAFLATLGLYLDSAAVIIGAMILAPLMSPLVSIAMGLLRASEKLFRDSLEKLLLGIALVLTAAALTSLIFPFEPVTNEMSARLHPSLPDLFVAIFAGIAAAYARAFKEIASSLAGVAIAVALVPPLSVAGIGLGRADPAFFGQAFLLFFTNLVGIVLAATLTFRVLGFSPTVHGKRRLGAIALAIIIILAPLGLSSTQIARRWEVQQLLEQRQLQINGKALRITQVDTEGSGDGPGIVVTVVVDEPLLTQDFSALRAEIRSQVGEDMRVRLEVQYLL